MSNEINMATYNVLQLSPLSDRFLIINGFARSKKILRVFAIFTEDGKLRDHLPLSKHESPELDGNAPEIVAGNEDGSRFAVVIATWRGGSRVLDISGKRVARRIVVYETAAGKELASFPVSPSGLIHLAISPDGHRVAVLIDGILKIADIP